MGIFKKDSGKFKYRNQMMYALFVVVVIPVILIINSLWLMDRFHKILDSVSQQEATLAHDIISSIDLPNYLSSSDLSVTLTKIVANNSRVKKIGYLSKDPALANRYTLYASSNSESGSVDIPKDLLQFVHDKHQPYIGLTRDETKKTFQWTIVSEIEALPDGNEGIIMMNLDASSVQTFLADISTESLVVLVVLIVFILLLLINHLRFYDYSLLYSELKQIDQMKDDFFTTASHEIRTPLTSIAGYASLAADEIDDKETVKHALNVISTSASRLSSLVENLLDISRIEQGRVAIKPVRVSLVQITGSVYDELLLQVQEKGLVFNHSIPAKDIFVMIDSDKFKQILFNILSNSIKYTLNGSITVSYAVSNGFGRVIITDTGIGMRKEQRTNLFSKFYRVNDDKTRKVYGNGLGLWITKQLVELMHGKIEVESEYERGSVFSVSFPVIE